MRVALITNGISSTLHSSLELSRRLVERGHEVTYLCHVDLGEHVAAHGHGFVRLTAPDEARAELRAPLDALRDRRLANGLRGLSGLPHALRRRRRDTAAATELIDALVELDPDLLVIDTEAHVAIIASSRLGIPTVLTTFMFCSTRHRHVPPLDSTLGPDDAEAVDRAWERTAVAAKRARWRRRISRRGLVDLLGPISYGTTSRVALRAVARTSGFDLAARTDADQWLRPHHYRDLPTLTTNLWELEFDHQCPANWHYVGPMVHLGRADTRAAECDSLRWESFRARRGHDTTRPLVYCSLGSYWSADVPFLSQVIEVFRSRLDWDLVVGLGGTLDPGALEPTPETVLVLAWAPQVDVLGAADVAIVHGGNAGLNECVVHGVPMVVYSTGHLDQNGVAARVAHHGVGVVGKRLTDTSTAIEQHLRTVLDDDSFGERIRALRDLARDPSRMNAAAELLESCATRVGDR